MNTQLLIKKLELLDEGELSSLYGELIQICTGKLPEDHPEIRRQISIIETTDSTRGSLLHSLLGEAKNLDAEWIPGNSDGRLYLNTILSFESDPHAADPIFYLATVGQGHLRVEESQAKELARVASRHSAPHIHIVAALSALPEGWTVVCYPPLAPNKTILERVNTLERDAFWALDCSNKASAIQILGTFEDHPELSTPLLVRTTNNGSNPSSESVEYSGHVRFVESSEEAVNLLQTQFNRVEQIAKPSRDALIYAILLLNENALTVRTQKKAMHQRHATLEHKISKAANEWKLLFLNERREGIRDLQLESVAYMMTRMKLLSRNSRQARVAIYAQTQLYPRVRNLVERLFLDLEVVANYEKTPTGTMESASNLTNRYDDAGHLRAGILHALPSLGLVVPISLINGTEAKEAVQHLRTNSSLEASSPASEVNESLLCKMLKPITDRLDDIKDNLGEINEALGDVNETMGKLIDVLVASAAGMAVAGAATGVAASFVMVKGSIVLRQTEEMIYDLINDTEAMWPRIEKSLRAVIPALNGELDERVVKNAHHVITKLEKL
jgi:hypothetical protein